MPRFRRRVRERKGFELKQLVRIHGWLLVGGLTSAIIILVIARELGYLLVGILFSIAYIVVPFVAFWCGVFVQRKKEK